MVQTYGQPLRDLITINVIKNQLNKTVHQNFCKHITGITRSTSNLTCTAKLGRYPLKIATDLKVLNFYSHIIKQKDENMLNQALALEKNAAIQYNKLANLFTRCLEDVELIINTIKNTSNRLQLVLRF